MPESIAPSAAAQQLAARLAQPKPMRRGSVSQRFVKCSKPSCACASDPKARHGPYFSLTRAVGGRTRSRFLTSQQAEMVGQQIEAGQQFRQQVDAYWKVCEQWADEELRDAATASAAVEAVKKRGSKGVSKRKLPKRSSS